MNSNSCPHIVYGVDSKYLPCVLVSMYTVLKSASEPISITIFSVGQDFESSDILKLANHFPSSAINIRKFRTEELIDYEMTKIAERFSAASLIPLFIPSLIEGKCLFLDADTLILQDISQLYDTDLNGHLIGAVLSYPLSVLTQFSSKSGKFNPLFRPRKEKLRKSLEQRADRLNMTLQDVATTYFSTGVVLFDTSAIRNSDPLGELTNLKIFQKFWNSSPDEEYFNYFFRNRVHFCELKWNVYKDYSVLMRPYFPQEFRNEIVAAILNPGILHFPNFFKKQPWNRPWYRSRKRYSIFKRACLELQERTGINVISMFNDRI